MFDRVKPSARKAFVLNVKIHGGPSRSPAGQRMRTARYECTAAFADGIAGFFAERGFVIRGGFGAGEARAFTISDGIFSVYLAYVRRDEETAILVLRAPGTSKWWGRAQRNAFQEQVHHDLLTAGARPSAATQAWVQTDSLASTW